MPQIVHSEETAVCSLQDCAEVIRAIGFDPACEHGLASTAKWLKRLNNNSAFLGDHLVAQLANHHREEPSESGYGPQAIVLGPRMGEVFLRANIWPSQTDHCFKASGAKTFVYGVPHDHNFSFLTSGYFGPGYGSDYYEYDYETVAGYSGEKPGLRFAGREQLSPGKMLLYRAHRDIHSQIPPESLSVSLNVMHIDHSQHWFDQYGFDLDKGEVSKVLSPNSTEVFLRAAVATRRPEAMDLAEQFGRHHPSDRIRLASFEAREKLLKKRRERDRLWHAAELSGSVMLTAVAKRRRAELEAQTNRPKT